MPMSQAVLRVMRVISARGVVVESSSVYLQSVAFDERSVRELSETGVSRATYRLRYSEEP